MSFLRKSSSPAYVKQL
ncbi:hypothetical protein OIU74_019840, partial [Salix koriyanagi]